MVILDRIRLSRSHISMCKWRLASCTSQGLRSWAGGRVAALVLIPSSAAACCLEARPIAGLVQAVLA